MQTPQVFSAAAMRRVRRVAQWPPVGPPCAAWPRPLGGAEHASRNRRRCQRDASAEAAQPPPGAQAFRRALCSRQRVKQLVAIFRARIGADADDPVTDAAIRRAAETVVLSEHLRARALRGEDVSADDVLRLSRTADLLTRRLQLDKHKAQPSGPTLSDYLRARTAATRLCRDDDDCLPHGRLR